VNSNYTSHLDIMLSNIIRNAKHETHIVAEMQDQLPPEAARVLNELADAYIKNMQDVADKMKQWTTEFQKVVDQADTMIVREEIAK
jgi:hypothetical protein